MTEQEKEIPDSYALLIGVDCYLPNLLPNGGYYPNLGGCVRDVSYVETFLRRAPGLGSDRIVKLTATKANAPEPPEPREQWPTYENMVGAFKRIADMAQPGDHVYIHYSGHGGRASTIYPELKGANGIDEALVPTDIGNSGARYLRDLELASLLNAMVEKKGLIVAVVLDSCHSGGMARGTGDVAVRGIGTIDTQLHPTESLVGSQQELADLWHKLSSGQERQLLVICLVPISNGEQSKKHPG